MEAAVGGGDAYAVDIHIVRCVGTGVAGHVGAGVVGRVGAGIIGRIGRPCRDGDTAGRVWVWVLDVD
jgi:hypothetical protein